MKPGKILRPMLVYLKRSFAPELKREAVDIGKATVATAKEFPHKLREVKERR